MTSPLVARRGTARALVAGRGAATPLRPPLLRPPPAHGPMPDPDWDDAQYDAWMDAIVAPWLDDPLEE